LKNKIHELARLYNVQTAYYGLHHRRCQASPESMLGVLKALGAPVTSMDDVPSALRERKQFLYRRILEPVTVVWDGEPPVIRVCLPSKDAGAPANGRLELESGENRTWKWVAGELPVVVSADVEGVVYLIKEFILPERLPFGYHKFVFKAGNRSGETMIIASPLKAYMPTYAEDNREWGAFLPLYALRTNNGWGSGDYSGLKDLTDWVAEVGGQVVATLPLLPVFLDKPFEPSPYAPVSRLLWNEFYVDITTVPELTDCNSAGELMASVSFITEIEGQRKKPMVDHRKLMSLKRQVMEKLSCYLSDSPGRLEELNHFSQEHAVVGEYARFRAVMEKYGAPWTDWPQTLRDGTITEGDYDGSARDYHLYAQWLAHRQVKGLSENARSKGIRLYFDLPVGVHPLGFDTWRYGDVFALNAEAGAPPDALFTNGQNWWSPPLHPETIREQHYRYVIDYLRHHLQYADILRIDHVMGLHRLFWIPRGFTASEGVYVHYHAEELYAILTLESHRYRSVIIGEDLGTVPPYVRPAMARHGFSRMYILYFELADNVSKTFKRILRNSIAGLNTHDMPPFAAFWEGTDIQEKKELGLLDDASAREEKRSRRIMKSSLLAGLRKANLLQKAGAGTRAVLQACLTYLGKSPARFVLVNLEDLWLEKRSQNIPGTGDRFPSWRRKARYSIEEFCRRQDVRDILEIIGTLRKKGKSPVRRR
jgi:4-alpha-glucanotransferase